MMDLRELASVRLGVRAAGLVALSLLAACSTLAGGSKKG